MKNSAILIVDDEPKLAEMMAELLEPLGHACTALSAAQTLGHLHKSKIDLLITDLVLEDKNGIQLIREAIELQPDIATVLITGFPSSDTLSQARNLGVSEYFVKPFAFELLLSRCTEILNERQKRLNLQGRKGPNFYEIQSSRLSGLQKEILTASLARYRGNVSRAANMLDMSRTNFYRYLNIYKINPKKYRA